jgi:hypothetical protein
MATVILSTYNWSSWPGFAGSTWVPIQYLVGFLRLGVEAFWVDHLAAVDPRTGAHGLDYLMTRFGATARDLGFADRYSVVYNGGERRFGLTTAEVETLAGSADLLISISGKRLPEGSPLLRVPRRAYLDVDPGFMQIWAHECDMGFDQFNSFFTIGQNVGRRGFRVPTRGIDWQAILPPVVLDLWPPHIDETCRRFSTIADWWGKQYVRFEGQYYGSKREEFLRFVRVPVEANQTIEVALTLHPGDHREIGLLHRNNWRILDPYLYAGDIDSYREFIRYSRAEFSVAKSGYVRSRSGWVSDRSACYLASGKPVLVQSTGFEPYLPTGEGLLTFRTAREAVAGIESINRDYLAHCQAARRIAERHFESGVVLTSLLRQVGVSA